ncbi:MAG: LPD28 domain-containing protein [Thermodesulfobacteriota bacterium]
MVKLIHSGDVIIEVYEDRRIPVQEQKPDLFYYQCRHSEDDWSTPVTIERNIVWVDFWGTVVTREPMNFNEDDFLDLTSEEGEAIVFFSQALERIDNIDSCAAEG